MQKHFTFAVDADGIALITMDSPGRSMNVLGPEVEQELAGIVETVACDAAIRGAIITGIVLDELERRNLNTALVTLCVGAGMGTATIIERV